MLEQYHRAAIQLKLAGARYSDRILYKPKKYELEALEIHYRVHAAIIKWLSHRLDDFDLADLRTMQQYVHMFREHGVCRTPSTGYDNIENYRTILEQSRLFIFVIL